MCGTLNRGATKILDDGIFQTGNSSFRYTEMHVLLSLYFCDRGSSTKKTLAAGVFLT